MKIIGVLQPSYLPWLGFFEQIHRSDIFVIYDDVQYSKGSWRNRNRIRTSQGWHWLSVPVFTKGHSGQLIQDVKIKSETDWVKKHVKTLETFYCKAPYYETFMPEIKAIYLAKDWQNLVELNMAFISCFCQIFSIETPLIYSSQLNIIETEPSERLVELIQKLDGSCFYEGAAGQDYLNLELFKSVGIDVCFQAFKHPVYQQLYPEFIPYLSAIDFLMNCGSDFHKYCSL